MLMPAVVTAATEPDPFPTPWRTVREAARYCRCSAWTIRQAAKSKLLRSSGGGHGKPMLFREEWLDEWLEHHR